MMPCFCLAFLHSQTVPKQYYPEISVPATRALQPSFEGPPMAPANMETLVAESTQGTPSRLPSKTKGLLGLYDAHHQLKYLKDPAHFSETFLGEIDFSKPSHRSYDCTITFLPSGISLPESFPRSHSLQPEAMLLRHKHPACHSYN